MCRGPVCNEKAVAKGLCAAHYKQMQRDGRMHIIDKSKLPEDKFWKHIKKKGNNSQGAPLASTLLQTQRRM
jgi:hypothetical protein